VHRIGIAAAAVVIGLSVTPAAVAGAPSADLAVAGPVTLEPVRVGERYSIALTVTNLGPDEAVDVVVSVGLAQGPVLIGYGYSHGECTNTSEAIECTISALPAGEVAVLGVERYVTGTPVLETTVAVRSATPDPDPTDDTLLDVVTVLGEACTQVGDVNEPDRLIGGSGPDVLCGLGGADVLIGRGGPDHLYGGPSDDRLVGRRGGDELRGGDEADRIIAGAGADEAMGEGGVDDIDAVDGVDANDVVVGGADDDLCVADPLDVVLSCP
jgi:Ca2+-binding RTX toxin-like protein